MTSWVTSSAISSSFASASGSTTPPGGPGPLGSGWTEAFTLRPGDAAAFDKFGTSVTTSEAHILVGSPRDNNLEGIKQGSAYALQIPVPTADLSGDGMVDGADLADLLATWGAGRSVGADLNRDGRVNGADLAILLASWGPLP